MSNVKFSKEHEWVRLEGDIATVGITDYAQSQLGDIVYVELPDIGTTVDKDGEIATVESVKAASEIYAPITGEVSGVNEALNDDPSLVNSDAEGDGWIFKLKVADEAELDELMDPGEYEEYVKELD